LYKDDVLEVAKVHREEIVESFMVFGYFILDASRATFGEQSFDHCCHFDDY